MLKGITVRDLFTIDVETLSHSSLVIGDSAIIQEAALLGIPNISYSPLPNHQYVLDRFYFPRGLSIRVPNAITLLAQTREMLRNLNESKEIFIQRAKRLTASFEAPSTLIFQKLSEA